MKLFDIVEKGKRNYVGMNNDLETKSNHKNIENCIEEQINFKKCYQARNSILKGDVC